MNSKNGLSYPLLFTTVALGAILAPLNSTMLAVALPEIRRDFDIGHGEIGWLVSLYLIAMAVAQPLGGRLGDQLGRARMFRAGLIAFLVFSIAAAFSPNFPVLVMLRTGQALVGAAVIPNGMAMMRETVPVERLGRSNGLVSAFISVSAAAGPLVGAGLLATGSWRLLFLVNVPLVALALLALTRLQYQDRPSRPLSVDWLGTPAFAALLVMVTFLLNSLRGGRSALLVGGAVAVFVALFALTAHRQLTSDAPIAEWRLFRSRSFAAATSYIMLSNMVMYTTLLSVPFFIEEVQGKGSGTTGLLLGGMSILMAALAPVAGRISDAWGRRIPAMAGGVVTLAAVVAILAGMSEGMSPLYLGAALAFLGLGVGMSFGAATTAAIESAPRELAGSAAGTNSMMRYLGSIVGVGMLGAVLGGEAVPEVGLFRLIFVVLIVVAAIAAALTLMIHRFPPEGEAEPAIPADPFAPAAVR